jgi:1-deoxy-D-xylulose-5-phosphate reductoisomerase
VTVQALAYSKRLALANKESLIAGAPVVRRARESGSGEILPVDSEHCAIHQCIGRRAGPEGAAEVRRIILTASGGPFRGKRLAELRSVAVADALSHPTWKMGPKITVDSSTLMNKGLEVLEAKELFGLSIEQIEIVVHPQSIVHSMVEFCDGATIAQLSWPDMRLPIGYCLAYPDRLQTAYGALDWSRTAKLEFEEPDAETFACLRLAYDAGREGGAAPAWLNAANEVAVAAFLEGRIGWLDIASVVKETMERFAQCELCTAEDVLEADGRARACAALVVERSYAA